MSTIAPQARGVATQGIDRASVAAVEENSHRATRRRFDSQLVAARYPSFANHTRRDRREWNCIRRLLVEVPAGAQVLDLPCGTGRMTGRLARAGYSVTAADTSRHMLKLAIAAVRNDAATGRPSPRFSCCDILQTPFENDAFDAVVCNRLIHHFSEPEIRRAAFEELARICRGPIVVSFFRDFGIDAMRFRLKHALRGSVPTDRIPISLQAIRDDVRAAGLTIVSARPTRWGVSPQWYVVLARASR